MMMMMMMERESGRQALGRPSASRSRSPLDAAPFCPTPALAPHCLFPCCCLVVASIACCRALLDLISHLSPLSPSCLAPRAIRVSTTHDHTQSPLPYPFPPPRAPFPIAPSAARARPSCGAQAAVAPQSRCYRREHARRGPRRLPPRGAASSSPPGRGDRQRRRRRRGAPKAPEHQQQQQHHHQSIPKRPPCRAATRSWPPPP